MSNLNNTIEEAISVFGPLEKLNEPVEVKELITIPVEIWEKLKVNITGYELDGETIIIHTDRPGEYSFELHIGSGRFDFLYWIAKVKEFDTAIDAGEWLDSLGPDDKNNLAEEYAEAHTEDWKIVEP